MSDQELHANVANMLIEPRHKLAAWQSQRLASCYADLRVSERYAPATEFFLQDIYGPKDFSKRDHDAERVVGTMRRLLPERAMQALDRALHLNRLTQQLDAATAYMLFEQMGVHDIDEDSYCEAYRRCDFYDQRVEQIRLVEALGLELDKVVTKPFVQMALKLARGPAHMAGLGELQDFLERGVAAFVHMRGAEQFLATIASREYRILDAIHAGASKPFSID